MHHAPCAEPAILSRHCDGTRPAGMSIEAVANGLGRRSVSSQSERFRRLLIVLGRSPVVVEATAGFGAEPPSMDLVL